MKSLFIVSSGILPVPAVRGGAIENRIGYIINYNEEHPLYDITVLSIYDEKAEQVSKRYKHTRFIYISYSNNEKRMNQVVSFLSNRVKIMRKFLPQYGLFIFKIRKFLNRKSYDKVLIENIPEAILFLKRQSKCKYYVHLGNDVLNENTYNASTIFEKFDKILCVSDYIRRRVMTIPGVSLGKIAFVPQGTRTEDFDLAAQNRKDLREKFCISDDDVVFVFCGRIDKTKGIEEALTAFCEIEDKKTKFLIIGDKSVWTKTDEFTRKLKRIAESRQNDIIFTGYVSHDIIPRYYTMADVAVLPPTWQEAGGNTIVEAVAAGLPLITTDSGGNKEYCNSDCAFILDIGPNLKNEIYNSMDALIKSEELRRKMGMAAKEQGSRLTWRNHVEHVLKEIE